MGYLLAIEPKEPSCSENLFFFLGTHSAILETLLVANPSKWQQPFKEIWERLRVLETGPGCSWNILVASQKVTGSHPGSPTTSEKIKIQNIKITVEHPYASEQDENLKFQFPRIFWSVSQHVPF